MSAHTRDTVGRVLTSVNQLLAARWETTALLGLHLFLELLDLWMKGKKGKKTTSSQMQAASIDSESAHLRRLVDFDLEGILLKRFKCHDHFFGSTTPPD